MGKPKVLLLKPLPDEAYRMVEEHCDIAAADGPVSRGELLDMLAETEGLLQTDVRIDAELLDKAPKLRVVSNVSVGYNNFDTAAMKARGVIGTHTPGVLDETVADLVLALLLSAARRVTELDALVKRGEWGKPGSKAEDHFGLDVHDATLGIIGMGRIGEAVARRAVLGFGMNVVYHNRHRKPEAEAAYGASYRELEALLRESDFVVLLAPLTAETSGMIRREHFELMKPTAVFINASRGQLVDEAALVQALRQRWIRAAALDVYEKEPVDPANPLLALPNVVTLPHVGSATAKTRFDMAMLAANNLVGGLLGDRPIRIVPELR